MSCSSIGEEELSHIKLEIICLGKIFFYGQKDQKEKWGILRKFVSKVPFLKWNYVTQFTLWQSLWLIVDLILILYGLNNLTFPWCIFEWLYSQTVSFFTLSESFIVSDIQSCTWLSMDLDISFLATFYFTGKKQQISLSSCRNSVV